MVKKIAVLVLLTAAVLALPAAAQAQPQATLILSGGERVRGQLVDMNGSDFTMTVGGSERRISIGEVAVIDFVGGGSGIPATETSKMQSGRTLIFMRGGDFWYGQLYDMSERDPLRITFRTPDGERQVMSSEVGRIFLRKWEGMPSGDTSKPPVVDPPPQEGRTFTLRGNQRWVNTGITVRRGQMVSFTVTGEIQLSDDAEDMARPAGSVTGRMAGVGAPLANQLAGAFIGRIGNTNPFGIGNQTQFIPMPAAGTLFIGINEARVEDNQGEYQVEIRVR